MKPDAAAIALERRRKIVAAHAQLLAMIEELDREEQYQAVCYLSMALDVICREHAALLGSR